ncbi:MAG: hypothetical protein RBT38_04190 [Bacteroidales bacterium]|jgi:hypothetical protein|nr:hypothetical protein [Bacteroidales bacterium]
MTPGRYIARHIAASLIVLLLFVSQSEVYSQEQNKPPEEKPTLRERLFFGGNFGLQFGTLTDIQFSPVIGMWVLPRLALAAGPNFRYFKDPFDKTIIWGGKVYSEFIVVQDFNNIIPIGLHAGLFLHLEDEVLSLESSFFKTSPYESERFVQNTILAGGGMSQQIGRRSSINLTFLWALTDSDYGIYGNPEIRVSFNF